MTFDFVSLFKIRTIVSLLFRPPLIFSINFHR